MSGVTLVRTEGHPLDAVSHGHRDMSAVFDDANLVSCAGLAPAMALAHRAGLGDLVAAQLTLLGEGSANAHPKVSALVAGMVAGADCIDDMDLLRHGGMDRLFTGVWPLDVGHVHWVVHVRSRPPARRRRSEIHGRPSSSRSSPTPRRRPGPPGRRSRSPRTAPGSCWPRSRSTSPAPPRRPRPASTPAPAHVHQALGRVLAYEFAASRV